MSIETLSKEEQEEIHFDKCVGQFRLALGVLLAPLRLYGQDVYVDGAIPEIVSIAIQLYHKLSGVDMPYFVNGEVLG